MKPQPDWRDSGPVRPARRWIRRKDPAARQRRPAPTYPLPGARGPACVRCTSSYQWEVAEGRVS